MHSGQKIQVREVVMGALGITLVFLATYVLKIPNAMQGYVNLGDGFILLFATLLHPFFAFVVGGVGSALADAAGGYGMYVVFTLLIKGMEGLIVCLLLKQSVSRAKRLIVYSIASLFMVGGYFIADAFVNNSWQLSLTGVPGNLVQALAGIIIAYLAFPLIQRRIPK